MLSSSLFQLFIYLVICDYTNVICLPLVQSMPPVALCDCMWGRGKGCWGCWGAWYEKCVRVLFFFFLFEGGEGLKHDVYCWAKILEGQAFRKIDYLIIYYCHFLPYELLCLSVFFLFLLVYYPLWLLLLIDKIVCCILQIMIGILFFLFEFYDDQLLAFMVLILVWLCELFTLIRSLSLSLSMIYVYIYISIYIYIYILCMFVYVYMYIHMHKYYISVCIFI